MASPRTGRGTGISKGNPARVRPKGKPPRVEQKGILKRAERFESGFRYSDRTISVGTTILITFLIVVTGGGFAIAALWADSGPEWVNPLAAGMVVAGIALPILLSAWFGATALHKFGGPVGALFGAGLLAAAVGNTIDEPLVMWGGIAALVVSGAGFFFLGYLAGVPMWIQLPMFGSPRTYIQDGDPQEIREARAQRRADRQAARLKARTEARAQRTQPNTTDTGN